MRRISVKEPVVFNNYGIKIKTKNVYCNFDSDRDPVYIIKFTITRKGLGNFLISEPDKIPVLDNALKTLLFYNSRKVTPTLEEVEKSFEKLIISKCPLNGDPIIMTSFKGVNENILSKKETDNELLKIILHNYVSVENKDRIAGLNVKDYNLSAKLRVDLRRVEQDLSSTSFSSSGSKSYEVSNGLVGYKPGVDSYLHRNFKTLNSEIIPRGTRNDFLKRDKNGNALVKETLTFTLHYLYMPGADLYSMVENVMNYRDRILLELSKHKLSLREMKLINLETNNSSVLSRIISDKSIRDSYTSRGIMVDTRDTVGLTYNVFDNNAETKKSQTF